MEKTIFQKIISREIPADIVYEDEETIAILDHKPSARGHTLVIPKSHSRNIFDITSKDLSSVMTTVQRIARALRNALHADGINIIQNNEEAAGQVVFHTHLHIIPRFKGDGYIPFQTHVNVTGEEQREIAQKIIDSIEKR